MIKIHKDESGYFLTFGNFVYNTDLKELNKFSNQLDQFLWDEDTKLHNENIKQKS